VPPSATDAGQKSMMSVNSAMFGAFLGTLVLVIALAYLRSVPGGPPGLGYWAIAFGVLAVGYLAPLAGPVIGPLWATAATETLQGLSAVFLFVGAMKFVGRRAPPWIGFAVCAAIVAWAGIAAFSDFSFLVRTLPIYGLSGLAMIASGLLLLFVRGDSVRHPYRIAAYAFILWGLHKLDYPILRPVDWLAPWGFVVAQVLAVAVAAGLMIVVMRHHREVADRELAARREAKAELREREQNYRALVEDQDALICRFLPDTTLTFVNEAYARFLGGSRDDLVGTRFIDLVSEDQKHDLLSHLASFHSDYRFAQNEQLSRGANGEARWYLWSNRAFFDDEGQVVSFQASGTDITALKDADRARRDSEQRLLDIAESASDWFWETDAAHRYAWAWQGHDDASGFLPDQIIGKTRWSIAKGDPERDEFWRSHKAVLDAHEAFRDFEYAYVDASGVRHERRVSGKPVFDEAGQFVGYRGTATDVTLRRRAERLLFDALESITDGCALFDADDRLVLFNSSYAKALSGVADILVPGTQWQDLATTLVERGLVLPENEDAEEWLQTRLREHRKPGASREFRTLDGRWVWVREYQTHDNGIFIVRTDITERRTAMEAARESEKRLSDAIESIGEGFALWDADERLVICNERYRKCYPMISEMLVPGVPFEDIVRESFERGQYLVTGSGERWIANRLENFRNPGRAQEQHIADGRWLLVTDKVTSDGGRVCIRTDITHQKSIERELIESRRRFRDFAEAASESFWEMDADLRYSWLSDSIATSFRMSDDDILGRTRQEIADMDPDDPRLRAHIDDLKAHRPFRGFEYKIRTKDGSEQYSRTSGVPVFDADGRFEGYRGIALNVTEEMVARREAERSRSQLEDAIECLSDGFALWDAEDRLVLCNQRYRDLYAHMADLLMPGVKFEDLTRTCAQRGAIVHGMDPDDWIAHHVEEHRTFRTHEQQLAYGSWLLVNERPTRNGGIVGVRTDITDLKRAEAELQSSRLMVQTVLDSIPVRVFWKDRDLVYLGCNKAFADDAGVSSPKDIVGKTDFDMPWKEQADAIRNEDQAIANGGDPKVSVEGHLRCAHDQTIYMCTTKAALPGAGSEIIGVIGCYEDITERKNAEETVKNSRETLHDLIDATDDIIALSDPDGTIAAINLSGATLLESTPEKCVGRKSGRLLCRLGVRVGTRVIADVVSSGEPTEIDGQNDGRFWETRLHPVGGSGNGPTAVTIYGRDVSRRRNRERRLRVLRRAVEQNPAAIIITDRTGTIEFVNPRFTEITQYTSRESLGQTPGLLKSGEMSPGVYNDLWSTIERGEVGRGELHNRRKDGSLYWGSATISPVRDADGRITHFVGIQEDVTERKAVEAKTQRLEARLRHAQKMETIGALAGGIAHDFNNILTPIFGYAQMGLDNAPEKGPFREDFEEILNCAKRAKALVGQILAFSRPSDTNSEAIHPKDVVDSVQSLLQHSMPVNVCMESTVDPSCPSVICERGQLDQVLMNLCTNAWQAMERRGGAIKVDVKPVEVGEALLETLPTLAAGQHVLITVSDTGPGIDENVVERVFDPFFTTKPRGKGSGLGLSTAIGIVRNLGGDIQVANKTDGGAEFAVYLPASGPRGAVETQLAAGAPKGDGERILVIDDEELNVDVVTRVLAGLGYSVVGTTTAGDALKAVKEEPDGFDLVLSDQLMPEMNGTDLARKIRKIKS